MSQTLDAVLSKGQTMPEKNRFPAVLQPVCATGKHTHCLTKSHHGSEDGTGRGTPIVIDRAAFNQGQNAQYEPHIAESEVMDSLVARGPHAIGQPMPHVAYPVVPLDGMNLLSRLGECGEEHSMQNFQPGDPQFTLKKGGSQHGVITPMAVRRLTPVECERLQGFPDNWSRIPWKGKPETESPDGPRYKACGNSMAVPVMRWIGERIAAVEASSHA